MSFNQPKKRGSEVRVDDLAGNWPGTYGSRRHRVPLNSRDEGSECESMTWRAMSARPFLLALLGDHRRHLQVRLKLQHVDRLENLFEKRLHPQRILGVAASVQIESKV